MSGPRVDCDEVVQEEILTGRLQDELQEVVSLDEVDRIASRFIADLYGGKIEGHEGLSTSDIRSGYSIRIEYTEGTQGADFSGLQVVMDTLTEEAWELWRGLVLAYFLTRINRDDE